MYLVTKRSSQNLLIKQDLPLPPLPQEIIFMRVGAGFPTFKAPLFAFELDAACEAPAVGPLREDILVDLLI